MRACTEDSRIHSNGDLTSVTLRSRCAIYYIFCHKVALPCFNLKILRADHWFHVAIYIRALIDQLDSVEMQHDEDEKIGDSEVQNTGPEEQTAQKAAATRTSPLSIGQIYLGAPQKPCSIEVILGEHIEDPAFQNFSRSLTTFFLGEFGRDFINSAQLSPATIVRI